MGRKSEKSMLLVGDIGGTNARLGLYERQNPRPVPRVREVYPSRKYSSPEEIVKEFLQKHSASISAVCLGVAGPVFQGRCRTTNLPWMVSEDSLARSLGCSRVRLLNDLEATIRAVPSLEEGELLSLQDRPVHGEWPAGLVAPGTGLGQALLIPTPEGPLPVASEGGHADFAPVSQRQVSLWHFLHKRHDHVSLERVASGPGLWAIYQFLQEEAGYQPPPWLAEQLKKEDPPQVIAEAGMQGHDPLCVESLEMYVGILGSICGNLALTATTRGGLYLAGGIAPRILPKRPWERFLLAFCRKGRFRQLMQEIPVKVIMHEQPALLGAALAADKL